MEAKIKKLLLISLLATLLVACGDEAQLPEHASMGPNPTLPEPVSSLFPTINIAPAKGWPSDAKPVAAAGLAVNAFAVGLDHPRWLYALPNGDVLVAETNGPERPDDSSGIRGWIAGLVLKQAGATTPSANRITLLRDANEDGIAEERFIFLSGLNSPFGMALIGNALYVANTDAVLRFPYMEGQTQISSPGVKIADLPAGPLNHHWTKNLLASKDGAYLYVTVGSNSNAAENGLEKEKDRAAVHKINLATGVSRIFASGLRNPNGMAWEPTSGTLWTVVNERDELGSDLVPDYLTSVRDGGFYGWPFSYWGTHLDKRVSPQNPQLVAKAIVPDYALGNHSGSLGLAFGNESLLPDQYRGGAFVGLHGSWNRQPLSGYKVIFVPFIEGRPAGQPIDILTGFINAEGAALGRPVGVIIDKFGALLVADDVGNIVWRVNAASLQATATIEDDDAQLFPPAP